MLNKYTPQPNTMDMGSMTMMGQPTVVGAGNDANNYLDARKERMTNDQGTVRIDHNFANGDTAFFRYSAAGEYGFMPNRACPASASITTTSRSRASWPGTTSSTRTWSTRLRAPSRAWS